MERNDDMRHAWDFVENTNISIFLTGKAGTGKTTFLKTLKQHSVKSMIVVAPTGVAAINAGGVTIHSFFQLPPSPYVPGTQVKDRYDFSKEKRKIIRSLDLLVIDEISMVRSDLLDAIDSVLRKYRNRHLPFGGVQLLMIGDLQQLTPVVTPEDEAMLKPYYDTPYFFGSRALQQIEYVTIELTHVYRQQDESFVELLNNVRDGHVSQQTIDALNRRHVPGFQPKPGEGYIRLTTHNNSADNYNEGELQKLQGREFKYRATVDGTFPEYNYPTAELLRLKEGAQVMFVKNDPSAEHQYYNGKIGVITFLDNERILVRCTGEDDDIEVKPEKWENLKYEINEKTKEIEPTVQGTFTQMPLRLAWAITIHKSQGLTFDHAIIDARFSFASGQVYVALSRCKTLEGMVLSSELVPSAVINDNRVHDYISHQHEAAQQSIRMLPTLKQEYERKMLMELFTFSDMVWAEDALMRLALDEFQKFPKAVQMHRIAHKELDEKVQQVSKKWLAHIGQMPYEQLKDVAFLERVRRSAEYFLKEVDRIVGMAVEVTGDLTTANKTVAKRLDAYLTDLKQSYVTKRLLLGDVADQGFSAPAYLRSKQEAIITAMSDGKVPRKRRAKTGDSEPKPAKEDTKQLTLSLYKAGRDIKQIARERGLTSGTILRHLAHFVTTGELDARQLLDVKKRDIIYKVLDKVGAEASLGEIKAACPDFITYDEIHVAIAERTRK